MNNTYNFDKLVGGSKELDVVSGLKQIDINFVCFFDAQQIFLLLNIQAGYIVVENTIRESDFNPKPREETVVNCL